MKKIYIYKLMLFFLFINSLNANNFTSQFTDSNTTLEPSNPYLTVHQDWLKTLEKYKTYKPSYISPNFDIPPYNIELQPKEFNALILLSRRNNQNLLELTKNEYLNNSWILLLYEKAINPINYPKTIKLIENSITDLNNFLLPVIDKNNINPPFKSYSNPIYKPDVVIPSYPSLQASQNKLAFLILEALNINPSLSLYTAINTRRLIYGLNFPQDNTTGNLIAEAFFNELEQNEKYQRDFQEAKKEW